MAVKDLLRVPDPFRSGIPASFRRQLNALTLHDKAGLSTAQKAYELLCGTIDRLLSGNLGEGGRLLPSGETEEQYVADLVSRLIVDAAFMHECLCRAGLVMGPYPYDEYADKITGTAQKILDKA